MGERVYGVLLRCYPRAFRARYEPGMRDVFARDYARVRGGGLGAVMRFWTRTTLEAAAFGVAERFGAGPGLRPSSAGTKGPIMGLGLLTDVRDALRSLRATPLVTVVAVLSLAFGIGANTALFSILNALVLKPLPVRAPEQLVLLSAGDWTNPIWEEIRARQDVLFDGAFAWEGTRFDLAENGPTDVVPGAAVSGRMFQVLGVEPLRGRLLTEADDVRGGGPEGPIAVVSEGLWRRRFGGTDDVIGRRIFVAGKPVTIVGVTPAKFFGPNVGTACDVMIPIADLPLLDGNQDRITGRLDWWLQIMARLKPGQTIEHANVALRGVQPQIRLATLPPTYRPSLADYLREPLTLVPVSDGASSAVRHRYEQPLTIMMVVVGAVLLIACANIASLLLARAVSRRRELVVRIALGASRLRLMRQLLLESLILAATGAAFGIGLARVAAALLVRQIASPGAPVFLDLSLDLRVLGFTTGVAVLTALIFGLAPALGVSKVAPNEVLREQTRSVTGDRRWSLRNMLVVAQVALSLALVVAAGLFVRTFASLVSQPLGYATSSIVTADINIQRSNVAPAARLDAFSRLRDAVASVPGVTNAAWASIMPLSGSGWNTMIGIAGAPALSDRERLSWVNAVTPGFFATYGITVVAGRDLSNDDRQGTPLVAVVNQAFARKFFEGKNPVGRVFSRDAPTGPAPTYEIVGFVTDAFYRRVRDGMMPTIYLPLAQQPQTGTSLALGVRATSGAREGLAPAITRALTQADPEASLTLRDLDSFAGSSVTQERLVATLSAFFGALALLLAALGLYGVTSYAVNRRRTEIGVRMALGADPGGVVRLVLGRVAWLVGVGIVAGIALSWWASKFIAASLLYGVTARDLTTFAAAAVALVGIGALAGWLPARRAARIDPTDALRES
jgi:putative ABC transport system permease protein